MIKLKDILGESPKKTEAQAAPLSPPHKFDKPTVIHISKDEMEILHKKGRLETDGITVIYGDWLVFSKRYFIWATC